MKTNNISFTSKINFVPESVFSKYRYARGVYVDVAARKNLVCKVSNQNVWTDYICSCVSGAAINTKTKDIAGFHLFHSKKIFQKCDEFLEDVFSFVPDADSALIIGGKDTRLTPYSVKIFDKIAEEFKKRIPNLTIFERHKKLNSGSDICYFADRDEWLINTLYSDNIFGFHAKDVLSQEELVNCFGKISIGDGDKLFMNDIPVTFVNKTDEFVKF